MTTPRQLKALYDQGRNISAILREERGLPHNTPEIIEVAYDLQTGSYIEGMKNEEMAKHKSEYAAEIARTILSLCRPGSVLEAGVGEATTLSGVLRSLGSLVGSYGFDLSWSRVAYAEGWLYGQGIDNALLCVGDLLNVPFLDSSIDVVYTSHSIEPNGGSEESILRELYRVARRYLVLLEPGYELASDEARRRMERHGYCRNLKGTAEALGYQVLEHKLFPFTANPLNPTALTVIRKEADAEPPKKVLACPKFKTPLREVGGMLFSPEALTVYPIVGGIPCLRVENGIFASKYEEVMGAKRQR
jgi:uncharacterized protein YbaR (Trm112 family)